MNVLPPITIPTFIQPIVESAVAWFTITFIAIPASVFFVIWDCPKSIWRFFFNDYPKVILITGANSGIGAELVLAYARKNITIGLIARDKDRLDAVSKACHKQGATTRIIQCDITNMEDLSRCIDKFDNENPIELLIANAAQSGATIDQVEDSWKRALEVNITGTLATVVLVYKKMRERKKGQIAKNHAEITWPFFEYLPTYATYILPPRILEVATYMAGKFNGFVTGSGDIAWT
ncbi:20451_t:CDS:2 [Entrophospora sp. SA101]|nr:20448_t:CDS:2 [Entrophospora sp. SA101]CAJ0829237.1 20451_t:CDS:2 [Entrophospora sp. SA101]